MIDISDPEKLTQVHAMLAQWDIPPVLLIMPFHNNDHVFQITTAGPTFMLKDISDAPNLMRLDFTRSVLAHVARTGLRVPLPLLSRDAQPAVLFQSRFYLLSEWIEAGEYPCEPELQAALFFHTGQAIATLHQALVSFSDEQLSDKTWREDLTGHVSTWMSALADGLPDSQAAVVKRVAQERGKIIEEALRGLPEQLIHRDCHPGNILVQGTHVVGFIDCDHICIGPRVFDLAYYAVHHLKWVTNDVAATHRWLSNLPYLLKGYCSQQQLSRGEVAALPYAMMAYHLLLSHWFMSLSRTEPIELEIQALEWIHSNLDHIVSALVST